MKIFYNKKLARQNVILMMCFAAVYIIAAVLWVIFLPEVVGFALMFVALFALMLVCGIICLKRLKAPYCIEFTSDGVRIHNGLLIPYEKIQCVAFSAELTAKATGVKHPKPALYGAAPVLKHLNGSVSIVMLGKNRSFVGICDICEGYEMAKKFCEARLIYSFPGETVSLYLFDRYEDKIK